MKSTRFLPLLLLFLWAVPAKADIVAELYTDEGNFLERLGFIQTVDFDDVSTTGNDPALFAADRYLSSHGIVINGESGQYAGTGAGFGFPVDYTPVSGANVYAPGAQAPTNGGATDGGNQTTVDFVAGGGIGATAGFGAWFIDVDFTSLGKSSLEIFDAGGTQLGFHDSFSGASGSQLFIGFVTVDSDSNLPVQAISSVELINGSGWPGVFAAEGVVLDNFTFGGVAPVPEPNTMVVIYFCASALMLRRVRACDASLYPRSFK